MVKKKKEKNKTRNSMRKDRNKERSHRGDDWLMKERKEKKEAI